MGDAIAFKKFGNFLMKCQNTMGRDRWDMLGNPDIICILYRQNYQETERLMV